MNDLATWLRRTIEGDKAAALATMWEGSGNRAHWEEIASATLEIGVEVIHTNDRMINRHIVLHDPENTIARCDAELALLDLYAEADHKRDHPGPADPTHLTTRFLAIGEAVWQIGQGYRHRDGWKDEWAV